MMPRELWLEIMHYGEFDRVPVVHWGGWGETRTRWLEEGLPADVPEHEFFEAVPMWVGAGVAAMWCNPAPKPPAGLVDLSLMPAFEEEVLEETTEWRILRQGDGAVYKVWKHRSGIPHFVDTPLKDAGGWEEYKKRLQPCPQRIPDGIDEQIARAKASGLPICTGIASMMGWIRNWMGVENFCYLMYDDRDVFADMVNTLADLSCWALDQVLPKVQVDIAHGWEDICGKSGPLVSPDIFDECVAPGYRKIREKLESYGCKLLCIDSDGDVSALVGHWLDAGVNVQFPIEIGTWNADPMAYRRQYGRELRVIGGINKLVLEKGPAEIDAEIERRLPLMKDGGFVPMPDHLITPGASLTNYRYYLDRMRSLRF